MAEMLINLSNLNKQGKICLLVFYFHLSIAHSFHLLNIANFMSRFTVITLHVDIKINW